MAEFFISPESQRAIQRELDQRQRRFESARARATEAQGERMAYANRLNPNASNQLKQAYAVSPMDDRQFEELSRREALQQTQRQDEGGILAGIGRVIEGIGMGAWNQVVKPTVRGAFTLWDAAQEELVMRPLSAALAADPMEGSTAERFSGFGGRFREAYDEYGDSALVNIVQGDLAETDAEGNPVEGGTLGHGFFPGGRAQAQSEQERTLEISGERATFGRALSRGIHSSDLFTPGMQYTPGDSAYDITAGVAQFAGEVALDPVAWGTLGTAGVVKGVKGVSGGSRTLGSAIRTISPKRANDAAEQVRQAGLISSSRRNTVLLEQADRLFKNPKILDEIAQADEYTIYRRMKMDRTGLGRGDNRTAELIQRLGATKDPTEVSNILVDAAARGHVRERGFYKGAGRFLPNPKEQWRNARLGDSDSVIGKILEGRPEFRFGGVNPTRVVSSENKMEAARDIDGLLRVGKVPEAERAGIVTRAFRAQNNDEMLGVVDESVRAIGRKMEDVGVDPNDVDELLRAHRESMNETTGYLLDEAGRPSPPPWKRTKQVELEDGTIVDTESISAGLIVNLNKRSIPLPDPQDIRRATAKYAGVRKVYQSNGWEMGTSAARGMTRYLFKFPTLFTRLAYPLRNGLDNNARTAGAGYVSIFNNPKAFFALGVRNKRKFRDLIESADEGLDIGRGFRTKDGRYGIVEEITEGSGFTPPRMRARWRDTDETFEVDDLFEFRSKQVSAVARTEDDWAKGIGALTNDAAGLWADDGAKAIGSWRTFHKGQKGDIRAWRSQLGRLANDPIAQRVADTSRYLSRDELIDDIIDSGLVDEVSRLGDDAEQFFKPGGGTAPDRRQVNEYIDWVDEHIDNLTGGDTRLRQTIATRDLNGVNFNDLTKNKRIDQILREQYYDRMPSQVMGDTFIEEGGGKGLWKRSMDQWVDVMASRPENRFTRHPLLAQVFADDLARSMMTLSDDAARQRLVQMSADAGFDDKLFPQIAQAAQDAAGAKGIVDSVEDVVDAAKFHSSDAMLDIAFDASQRSSFQETFDAMVPFWDAFAEVGTSWGRIFRDNPNALGRGMQAYQAGENSGFIYTNEMGEEVFAMPGGGTLSKLMGMQGIGAPQMEAPIEGLNLITQGFGPGIGPLAQWGVGAFMPDTPDLQWARDVLLPYGSAVESPSDLGDLGGLISDLTPAWLKKTLNTWSDGDIDPVAWNSAVGDALKVLGTSGDYDMSSNEDRQRLQADAEKAARWTTYLRSALQMGAPTGPGVAWEVETDPDGTAHRVATMASAYYDLLQESGDQAVATQSFIDLYGVEPFWIAQGKTNELVEGPRTREGFNWIQRHGDAAEKYPEVVGHFVPAEDPTAPPDYGVFRQRLESGEIESLTGEQQLALANKTKARTIYNVQKERLRDLPYQQRQRALRTVRDTLTNEFPGWDADVLGVSGGPDRDRKIALLQEAVQDPALADSPVTEPLSLYLQKRQQAFQVIAQRGEATTLGAQANADLRQWLADIGSDLSVRNPNFQGVWQTVLSSEVEE